MTMTIFRRGGRRIGRASALVMAGLSFSFGLPFAGAVAMPHSAYSGGAAESANSALAATATQLVASPSSAKVGDQVKFTATGFKNYGAVDLQIKAAPGWQTIATGTMKNKTKPVVMTATMPNLTPGDYKVRALGPGGAKPSTTVTIEDSPALSAEVQAKLKQTNNDGVWGVGDSARATVSITNAGNVPLGEVSAALKNSGTVLAASCDSAGQLAVAATRSCTATVKLSAADVQAGSIQFTAAARATGAGVKVNDRDNITLYIHPSQKVSLAPSPIHPGDTGTLTAVGFLPKDDVAFTMTSANGPATLLGNATADRKGHASLSWRVPGTLAPGSYPVVAKVGTEKARLIVQIASYQPHLQISKVQPALTDTNGDGVLAFGDQIGVRFTLTNDGDVALSGLRAWASGSGSDSAGSDVAAVKEGAGSGDCADLATLAPGSSASCDLRLPMTAAELSAGGANVTVTATGSAAPSGGAVTTSSDARLDINQTRLLSIDPAAAQVGQILDFSAIGFLPGNMVTFTVSRGDSIVASRASTCDSADRASAEWQVPSNAQPGHYTVTASEPGGRVSKDFTLAAGSVPPTPGQPGGGGTTAASTPAASATSSSLAGTGGSILAPIMVVAAAFLIGGLALQARRRLAAGHPHSAGRRGAIR